MLVGVGVGVGSEGGEVRRGEGELRGGEGEVGGGEKVEFDCLFARGIREQEGIVGRRCSRDGTMGNDQGRTV